MSSINNKALINILVYFRQTNLKSTGYVSFIVDSIQKSINNLYGLNRFVVYNVNESDLRTNTRLLSAKALLIISNNNGNGNVNVNINDNCNDNDESNIISTWLKTINLDKLILDYEVLLSSSSTSRSPSPLKSSFKLSSSKINFNHEYFNKQIAKIIPPKSCINNNDNNDYNNIVNNNENENNNELYLFDSKNHLYYVWSHLCTLKLVEYCPNNDNSNLMSMNDFVYYIDNNKINNEIILKKNLKINFDIKKYFNTLSTEKIGQSLLFQNITETTMKLVNNVSKIDGIVAVANYQTTGLGRSENQWLSPFGCAMFTINLHVPYTSGLISKITLIQHIASLSVILALPSDKLNLSIKWPNDILLMPSGSKLSGILVRSFSYEYHFNIQIGIGINVSNRIPTICLDDIIDNYNNNNDMKLQKLSREIIIAKILNSFEKLYNMLINGQINEIKKIYCSHWIHNDDIVDIYDDDFNNDDDDNLQNHSSSVSSSIPKKSKARIIGIDDNGYLLAQDLNDINMIHCLQPDSNRFDLMNRLLIQK